VSVPVADHAARRGLVAGAVVLVVLAVSVLSGSAPVRALAGGGCASAATPHVGLVIDFGSGTGAPGPSPQTFCEPFTSNMTGADLLAAAVGSDNLRWASSGLLCAIESYPAPPACGTRVGNTYQYWSYWHGGTAWTYANVGPAADRLTAGAVEGWHFVVASASSSNSPPDFASTGPCPAPTPTSAAPPSSSPTTGAPGATAPPAGTGGGSARTSGSATPTSAVTPSGSVATTASTAPGSATSSTSLAAGVDASHRSQALAGHSQVVAHPDRGSPVGPILVALVIAGLVVASVLIRRRRSPT
jgi:hypothetical protein